MYQALLTTHSYLRFVVLILLIVVIVTSLAGWLGKKDYTNTDNKLNLSLFISTHIQLLLGLILYVVSPQVRFGETTMKDSLTRYWTVEHLTIMLIAIVLITMARITSKKLPTATAKHKRVFIFNLIAFLLILLGIYMSGRGFY